MNRENHTWTARDQNVVARQQNSLRNLKDTLTYLSDPDAQIRYKQAVPFVHIPWELFAQLEHYTRLRRNTAWFQTFFSEAELTALFVLCDAMKAFFEHAHARESYQMSLLSSHILLG